MYDISLVIHTSQVATPADVEAIVSAYSQIKGYRLGLHPDVFILKPLEEKVSISIDQVHALHGTLSLSPVQGDQKVILIHPAHALTFPAQQALLKLVEEPPSKVLFLLITHTPYVLLPTILSRCRVVSYKTQAGQGSEKILFPTTHAEAIALADRYGAKKESALNVLHDILNTQSDPQIQKAAIKALGLLTKNINAKLVLDEFFFSTLT